MRDYSIYNPTFNPIDKYLTQKMKDKLIEHKNYIRQNGIDMPEVREWKWKE